MRVLGGGIDERLPRLQKEGRWLSSELSAFLPPPGSNKHKVCELLLWLYFLGLEEELVAKKEDSKGKGDVSCGTPTLSKQQVLSSQKTWPNMAAKWENCLFRSNLPKSTAVLIQPLTNLEERSLKNWHLMTIRWKPRSSSSGKMSLALGVLIMMDSCQRMKCMMCSQISKSVLQALRTSKVKELYPDVERRCEWVGRCRFWESMHNARALRHLLLPTEWHFESWGKCLSQSRWCTKKRHLFFTLSRRLRWERPVPSWCSSTKMLQPRWCCVFLLLCVLACTWVLGRELPSKTWQETSLMETQMHWKTKSRYVALHESIWWKQYWWRMLLLHHVAGWFGKNHQFSCGRKCFIETWRAVRTCMYRSAHVKFHRDMD